MPAAHRLHGAVLKEYQCHLGISSTDQAPTCFPGEAAWAVPTNAPRHTPTAVGTCGDGAPVFLHPDHGHVPFFMVISSVSAETRFTGCKPEGDPDKCRARTKHVPTHTITTTRVRSDFVLSCMFSRVQKEAGTTHGMITIRIQKQVTSLARVTHAS